MKSKFGFEWNYFPIREIIPKSGLYAIGCLINDDKSITYLTCNQQGDLSSIKVETFNEN
jgi:hypothetical protein